MIRLKSFVVRQRDEGCQRQLAKTGDPPRGERGFYVGFDNIDGTVVEAERRRLDGVFAMQLASACDWQSDDRTLVFD